VFVCSCSRVLVIRARGRENEVFLEEIFLFEERKKKSFSRRSRQKATFSPEREEKERPTKHNTNKQITAN